jgi:hypothetical protein
MVGPSLSRHNRRSHDKRVQKAGFRDGTKYSTLKPVLRTSQYGIPLKLENKFGISH